MKRLLAVLAALAVSSSLVTGCCVADGYKKAGCRDACNKAETQQVGTCASMGGEAKTTCEASAKTAHATCLEACDK